MADHISPYRVSACVMAVMFHYTLLQASDSGNFKTIVAFECRGVEPVAFDPRVNCVTALISSLIYYFAYILQGGFSASGENSGSQFIDISLANKVRLP